MNYNILGLFGILDQESGGWY